jgi:fluoroacetyl-CoA thioesterase
MQLAKGNSSTVTMRINEHDLATRWNLDYDDGFPPIFATSQMIGLMEVAAARVLHPLLKPGELSVGVGIDVLHSAPTAAGGTVRAKAIYSGMEGQYHCFEVVAEDDSGEIGRGRHRRAIIVQDRLLDGANKRRQAS